MKKIVVVVAGLVAGFGAVAISSNPSSATCTKANSIVQVKLDSVKHKNVLKHSADAIKKGYPSVLVIYRKDADKRRNQALKNIPTKIGYDRDEYPPAMGRKVVKTDVRYVPSSENRSAGAIMGNQLKNYCDGVKFRYVSIKSPVTTPTKTNSPTTSPTTPATTVVPTTIPPVATDPQFSTCTAAKNEGYGPYYRGIDPEYSWYQDRDGDGVVCE